MKVFRLIFICASFIMTSPSFGQLVDSLVFGYSNENGKQGLFVDKDPTGNIIYKNRYKNDKKNGLCRTSELNVVVEENYINGVLDGWARKLVNNKVVELKEYRKGELIYLLLLNNKGITTAEYQMKDGQYNGKHHQYSLKTGELIKTDTYKDGVRNGPSFTFYKNGTPKSSCTYISDKLEGLVTNYSKDGSVYSQYWFKNGEKIDQLFSAW